MKLLHAIELHLDNVSVIALRKYVLNMIHNMNSRYLCERTSCHNNHPTIFCTLVGTTSLCISFDTVFSKGADMTSELVLFLTPLEITHSIHHIFACCVNRLLGLQSEANRFSQMTGIHFGCMCYLLDVQE